MERNAIIRNRRASQRVGSGVLLGDRTNAIGCEAISGISSPDDPEKTSLPIRALERSEMLAGQPPLTSAATHALSLAFSWIIAKRELRNRSGNT
jgi:hypothetical protein